MISEQVLRKYYESTMKVLRYCSRHKDTKKVRETSDMIVGKMSAEGQLKNYKILIIHF